MTDFRRLEAWQSSQKLAVVIYQLTTGFPATERFGLVSQMRRAAVSTMSNIAEGAGRGSDREFLAFLRIARGSLHEVESQCLLAQTLGFISPAAADEALGLVGQTGRLLHGLIRALAP
ncbi:MAG TPA: four helix bundle protein [Gemmatimonadales bacterium]|jgi:four helix bundle protein|nr:four helix bundle protein [Gemmatimonadales bacterium]